MGIFLYDSLILGEQDAWPLSPQLSLSLCPPTPPPPNPCPRNVSSVLSAESLSQKASSPGAFNWLLLFPGAPKGFLGARPGSYTSGILGPRWGVGYVCHCYHTPAPQSLARFPLDVPPALLPHASLLSSLQGPSSSKSPRPGLLPLRPVPSQS